MARPGPSNRGQLHTWRYLGVLAGLFVVLYLIVFFAGSGGPLKPKLGLDLRGGAQVILTPKSQNGKPPSADQLTTAVEILRLRVNGAGVSEAEVLLQGQQIVVQVPGGNRDSIATVTKAAQLEFRKVLECANLTQAGGCSALPPTQIPPRLLETPSPSPSATPRNGRHRGRRSCRAGATAVACDDSNDISLLSSVNPFAAPTGTPRPRHRSGTAAAPSLGADGRRRRPRTRESPCARSSSSPPPPAC